MITVGLTGGIASGKSLVTSFLRELAVPVIDTDELARQVVAIGQPAWLRLREEFGDAYFLPDSHLDRAALARHVFADPAARLRLEAITHPAIFSEVERCLTAFRHAPTPPPLVVVVVPLLFEVHAECHFDRIAVVYATPEQQRTRLIQLRHYTPEEADARMAAQWPLEEKLHRADIRLDNSGTIEQTHAQVVEMVTGLSEQ